MIIMFMIAATSAVGSTATILLGAFCLLDSHTQLRTDLITKREKHDNFANRFAKTADAVGRLLLQFTIIRLNIDTAAVSVEAIPSEAIPTHLLVCM
jgi:hypothetical protein